MCNYKTLVYNRNGYIIKCLQCNRIQLAFGTTMVSMDDELFSSVTQTADMEYTLRNPCKEPEMKCTTIHIDAHTALCLNFAELKAVNEMLIQAQAILDTYMILQNS